MRDQLRSSGAGDVRAVLQEVPGCFFALTGDVARAHRLVKVAEQDWGLMGLPDYGRRQNVAEQGRLFGISSAAYHWSRLVSGLGRAVYYALGKSELYLLVYVDDLLWVVREAKGLELVVMSIFFLEVLGLSEVRARWLICWLEKAAEGNSVQVAELSSVLGRLSFGLTALGHLRPFLGPVYAWVAAMDGKGLCRVPKALVLIFKFLARALEVGRLSKVGRKRQGTVQELFRTDAKAETRFGSAAGA
eukprot:s2825_g10.t1